MGRKARAESTEKQAAKARQTQRRIERLEVVEEPRKEWELRMEIAAAPRSGTGRGDRERRRRSSAARSRLGPVTTQIDWGDRILITGANGSGKTTLLRLLLGKLALTRAPRRSVPASRSARSTRPAACSRAARRWPTRSAPQVPDWPDADVRTLLAKFGLRGRARAAAGGSLSPGERTRAALALLQARGVNLLVLDEPTNHLDLPAIEQLEQAMDEFDGTLLLVTHDRRMLDTIAAPAGGGWTAVSSRRPDQLPKSCWPM